MYKGYKDKESRREYMRQYMKKRRDKLKVNGQTLAQFYDYPEDVVADVAEKLAAGEQIDYNEYPLQKDKIYAYVETIMPSIMFLAATFFDLVAMYLKPKPSARWQFLETILVKVAKATSFEDRIILEITICYAVQENLPQILTQKNLHPDVKEIIEMLIRQAKEVGETLVTFADYLRLKQLAHKDSWVI